LKATFISLLKAVITFVAPKINKNSNLNIAAMKPV